MMRKIVGVMALILVVTVFSGCTNIEKQVTSGTGGSVAGTGQDLTQVDNICVDDTCFTIEIADEPAERMRGLMEREELDEDAGMLFVFENTGSPQFWMKNTLIPLDMLWLNNEGKVVHIEKNVPPCDESDFQEGERCPSYGPDDAIQAKYVLEVNGGITEEKNIQIGDNFNLGENGG